MKEIKVASLKPGMIFSEPVYIEGNNLLVPAGIPIKGKDLDRLASWGQTVVLSDGDPVEPENKAQSPSVDGEAGGPEGDSSRQVSQTHVLFPAEVQENKGAYRNYEDLITRLDSIFTAIKANLPPEASAINGLVVRLLQAVREDRGHIVGFILGGEVSGHVMAKSSINTAILSALIAMELKLSPPRVMQVVTAALLHDVGMLKLPAEITNKSGGLSETEAKRMQAHPLYAHRLAKELGYSDEVGLAALQHHERWDGEGYPRRTAGVEVDMGARIVSVADAFEAMVSEKPYRNSMMGYQAIKNLLSDNMRRFDPAILKAFVKTMGIYPIGSVVLLNNGSIARVTDVKEDAPLRPAIRILIDESGKFWTNDEGALVDLLTEKALFIVRALDPKEVVKRL